MAASSPTFDGARLVPAPPLSALIRSSSTTSTAHSCRRSRTATGSSEAVREYQPDVIVTHRTNDYHPDHRYTGVTVQDACYMVMVPNAVPRCPVPDREPVVIFMSDRFTKPRPIEPDLVFDIDSVIEKKLDSITSHASQMIEWLPWIERYADEVPEDESERRSYLPGPGRTKARRRGRSFPRHTGGQVRPAPWRRSPSCRGLRSIRVRCPTDRGAVPVVVPVLTHEPCATLSLGVTKMAVGDELGAERTLCADVGASNVRAGVARGGRARPYGRATNPGTARRLRRGYGPRGGRGPGRGAGIHAARLTGRPRPTRWPYRRRSARHRARRGVP